MFWRSHRGPLPCRGVALAAAVASRDHSSPVHLVLLRILGVSTSILDRGFHASLVRARRGYFDALDQLGLELCAVCFYRPGLRSQTRGRRLRDRHAAGANRRRDEMPLRAARDPSGSPLPLYWGVHRR